MSANTIDFHEGEIDLWTGRRLLNKGFYSFFFILFSFSGAVMEKRVNDMEKEGRKRREERKEDMKKEGKDT